MSSVTGATGKVGRQVVSAVLETVASRALAFPCGAVGAVTPGAAVLS
jgi:uncharacterized protein YbjT (DUF2867 family)